MTPAPAFPAHRRRNAITVRAESRLGSRGFASRSRPISAGHLVPLPQAASAGSRSIGNNRSVRPVIGITAYAEPEARWGVWVLPAAIVPLAYVRAVEHAGGRPLVVPPSEEGGEEALDA